ncbi:hypothetical protein ABZ746_34475 [Streptomyces sp. NPDC020096]
MKVRRYGRVDTLFLADRICLWYGSFHTHRDLGTRTGTDDISHSSEVSRAPCTRETGAPP